MSQRIIKPYDQIPEPFADRAPLDLALVCKAIHAQFPELGKCEVTPLLPGGWDNYSFRIGDSLIARIPSAKRYVSPVLGGPKPGAHNFFRGAEPSIYGEEVQECIRALELKFPDIALQDLWDHLTGIPCEKSPRWLHGDLNPANLLHRNGSLCAVLDFGGMAVGDPACDYSLAWTSFSRRTRKKFFRELSLDEGDVLRSAAWAFWKLLLNLHNDPENKKLIGVLETIEKETGDCF